MEPQTKAAIEQVSYLCELYKRTRESDCVPSIVVQGYCVDVATQYGVPEFSETIYREHFCGSVN